MKRAMMWPWFLAAKSLHPSVRHRRGGTGGKRFLCATGYASAIRLVRGISIAVIDMAFPMEGPFVRLRPQETWLTLRT